MANGFCQHGKLWTTCPDCGKEVIKAHAGRRREDSPFDAPRPVKRALKPVPAEPSEEWSEAEQ